MLAVLVDILVYVVIYVVAGCLVGIWLKEPADDGPPLRYWALFWPFLIFAMILYSRD